MPDNIDKFSIHKFTKYLLYGVDIWISIQNKVEAVYYTSNLKIINWNGH